MRLEGVNDGPSLVSRTGFGETQRGNLDACIWEYKDASVPFQAHQYARAAIEAMRTPNFGMLEDGDRAILDAESLGTIECWHAMIDAALSEKP